MNYLLEDIKATVKNSFITWRRFRLLWRHRRYRRLLVLAVVPFRNPCSVWFLDRGRLRRRGGCRWHLVQLHQRLLHGRLFRELGDLGGQGRARDRRGLVEDVLWHVEGGDDGLGLVDHEVDVQVDLRLDGIAVAADGRYPAFVGKG